MQIPEDLSLCSVLLLQGVSTGGVVSQWEDSDSGGWLGYRVLNTDPAFRAAAFWPCDLSLSSGISEPQFPFCS